MIPVSQIKDHKEFVIQQLSKRSFRADELVEKVLELDSRRRSLQHEQDQKQHEAKQISGEIGQLYRQGKREEADQLKERSAALKEEVKELQAQMVKAEEDLQAVLVQIPNVPHESVPAGKSSEENELVRQGGPAPDSIPAGKPHWELTDEYKLIDFELGVKITGSGFPVYTGRGARLQRALQNFFLDEASKAGYREVQPPILVNEDSGFSTGQLPDKEGQMYHIGKDNLYVIPTAEVPLTNIFRDVILQEGELPVRICAYSPCFRREAGSYGKDVRGLNRLHQFDKVEIVQVAEPQKSYEVLEEMVAHVEALLGKLELPYRILRLCGGDTGFAAALTFDFEVWSGAQQRWLEVSSVSNFEYFQSNRMKLRYRKGNEKPQLAHTLNGSALAFPRIVAALLENGQEEGRIRLPEVLYSYTGFKEFTVS